MSNSPSVNTFNQCQHSPTTATCCVLPCAVSNRPCSSILQAAARGSVKAASASLRLAGTTCRLLAGRLMNSAKHPGLLMMPNTCLGAHHNKRTTHAVNQPWALGCTQTGARLVRHDKPVEGCTAVHLVVTDHALVVLCCCLCTAAQQSVSAATRAVTHSCLCVTAWQVAGNTSKLTCQVHDCVGRQHQSS